MKVPREEMSVPLTFYIKDSEFMLSRSVHPSVTLDQVARQVFPQLFDAQTSQLLERFGSFEFRIAGFSFPWDTPVLYLYDTFKSTEGVLYFTVVY